MSFRRSSRAAVASQLSTQWILDEIHSQGIKDIEALLERFEPKNLERHLLLYGSESLQSASFLSPRVIIYSPSADFIMAFNGEPGSSGLSRSWRSCDLIMWKAGSVRN